MKPTFDVHALRLAQVDRPARDNFMHDPGCGGNMQLDFMMWLIQGNGRVIAVDTGFGRTVGERRGRHVDLTAAEAARQVGVAPEQVTDVVLTHLHYDHAGGIDQFPHAQIWVQQAELDYVASSAMRHMGLNHFFEADDVAAIIRESFDGRVNHVNGDAELTPGVRLIHLGGHTPGLQAVEVSTERGTIVLASDALHFYANLEQRNPFPAGVDLPAMLDGFERLGGLVASAEQLIPGHDPLIWQRYASPDLPDGVAALHRPPRV